MITRTRTQKWLLTHTSTRTAPPAVAIAALIVGIVALLVASAALWTALRTRPAIAVVKDVPMQRATNFGSEDVAARAQA